MVQSKELISIIVPVYRKKPFLDKMIGSVLRQTYTYWELILIDDRGDDGSLELMQKYAQIDQRIRIISNDKNRGVDYSRFEGIKHSRGEFLMFVDADDWISENAVEVLLSKMIKDNSDIVYGSITRVIDRFGILKSKPQNYYGSVRTDAIQNPELFEDYFISYFGVNKLAVSMWGKLYRKSVIEKAELKPTFKKMGEDLTFNMNLHPHLNKVSFVSDLIYFYRFGGMTTTANPTFLEDIKYQYLLKKMSIEKYSYDKALFFIRAELGNCFFSHFYNLKMFGKLRTAELMMAVTKELEDPIYLEMHGVINPNKKITAIQTKNIKSIVGIIDEKSKKDKYPFLLKKMLAKILK